MRLNTKGTSITLTPAISEYLLKKIQSLGKLIDLEDAAVIVDAELALTSRHHQQGDIFRAEVTIHRGKESFRGVAEREDLYTAIDEMQAELSRKLSSDKGRKQSLFRRGGARIKALLQGWKSWRR